jgi:hypothetical protein
MEKRTFFITRQKKIKKFFKGEGVFCLFVNKGLSFQNRSMIN